MSLGYVLIASGAHLKQAGLGRVRSYPESVSLSSWISGEVGTTCPLLLATLVRVSEFYLRGVRFFSLKSIYGSR